MCTTRQELVRVPVIIPPGKSIGTGTSKRAAGTRTHTEKVQAQVHAQAQELESTRLARHVPAPILIPAQLLAHERELKPTRLVYTCKHKNGEIKEVEVQVNDD